MRRRSPLVTSSSTCSPGDKLRFSGVRPRFTPSTRTVAPSGLVPTVSVPLPVAGAAGALSGRVNVKPSVATISTAAAAAPAHGFIQIGRASAGFGAGVALPGMTGFAGGAANDAADAPGAGAVAGEVEIDAVGGGTAAGGTTAWCDTGGTVAKGAGVTGSGVGVTATGIGAAGEGDGTDTPAGGGTDVDEGVGADAARGGGADAGGVTAAGAGGATGVGAATGAGTCVNGAGAGVAANCTGTDGAAVCCSDVRSASTAAAYLVRNERSDARSASGLA